MTNIEAKKESTKRTRRAMSEDIKEEAQSEQLEYDVETQGVKAEKEKVLESYIKIWSEHY
ncbi:MAG: hypothetical protein ACMG6E_10475 [Candidatus Roizmanbacteria bacterium]